MARPPGGQSVPEEIADALAHVGPRLGPLGRRLLWFDDIGSTNDRARAWAEAGAANRQSEARTIARRFMASPRVSERVPRDAGGTPQSARKLAERPPIVKTRRAGAPVGGPGGDRYGSRRGLARRRWAGARRAHVLARSARAVPAPGHRTERANRLPCNARPSPSTSRTHRHTTKTVAAW